MPVLVATTISIRPRSPDLATAAWSPCKTAMKGCRLYQSGWDGASACTSSRENITWKYMGCSLHSVPSLSKTAMRSWTGTKSGLPGSVTAFTKATMAVLDGPSVQDASSACFWRSGPAHPANRNRRQSHIHASRRKSWFSIEGCKTFSRICRWRASHTSPAATIRPVQA
ncbi:hypothetical protein D3C87_1190320 [compost metagenome]